MYKYEKQPKFLEKKIKGTIVCVTGRGVVCLLVALLKCSAAPVCCAAAELSVLHCGVPWQSHEPLPYHAVALFCMLVACTCSTANPGA